MVTVGIRLLPFTQLSDNEVADALGRAVAMINPVLAAYTRFDPLGLRERTHAEQPADGAVGRSLDLAAAVVNFAQLPGTKAWVEMDRDGHVKWWVHRAGAVTTIPVAFPGAFGIIADRLGVQDVLGFTNQAIVLCAVAREGGVTDPAEQAALLGAVLCDRQLPDAAVPASSDRPDAVPPSLPAKLWDFAGVLRAVADEFTKRPHPQKLYHYLGMLPGVGAVADYVGEYTALLHAADEGAAWLRKQPPRDPAPDPI